MFNNILSKSSQQKAQNRAAQKAADIETASVSTFASSSDWAVKMANNKGNTSPQNGTIFSEQELKDKLLKSQIRLSI